MPDVNPPGSIVPVLPVSGFSGDALIHASESGNMDSAGRDTAALPPLHLCAGSQHRAGLFGRLSATIGGWAELPASGLRCRSPPKPSSVCQSCWKSPLAAHLGLLREPITRTRWRPHAPQLKGGYRFTRSTAQLQAGSNAGCRCCLFLYAHFVRFRIRTQAEHYPRWPWLVRIFMRNSEAVNIRVGIGTSEEACSTPMAIYIDDYWMCAFKAHVWTAADDPMAPYLPAQSPIQPDAGHSHTLDLARMAIESCAQNHEGCVKPPASPATLPARLIDCSKHSRPRLVRTSNNFSDPYLALSYVWGGDQLHKTTTVNVSAYCTDGIDLAALPQTIRDAIHVAHALGMRYIWIDSLCIIQDDKEDKSREIQLMRHIYRNAHCTIIAASAQRVSQGFLPDYPAAPYHGTVSLPLACPPSRSRGGTRKEGTVNITALEPYREHGGQGARPLWRIDDLAEEPVSSRAWCMQELLMSPRSLVFGLHTLQFHCRTSTTNIAGPFRNSSTSIAGAKLPTECLLDDPPLVVRGSAQWHEAHLAWWHIVDDYSRRSITEPSDKLVACGGIAEEFHRILGSEYIAGIWRDVLPFGLLWRVAKYWLRTRPKTYRAPSWSWAAVEGPVVNTVTDLALARAYTTAEVVRCDVTLEDGRLPFGQVASASLVLRAPLIAAAWKADVPGPDPDDMLPTSLELALEDVHISIQVSRDSKYDAQDGRGAPWVLPIRWRRKSTSTTSDSRDPGMLEGIIVTEADVAYGSGGGAKHYRRIGYFRRDPYVGHGEAHAPVDWIDKLPLVDIEIV